MARGATQASKNLVVDLITQGTAAKALVEEWNELAVAVEAQPFGLPALALSWWEHLGKGELRIATARYGDGRLAGLAPLYERSRGGLRTTRFLGFGMGAIGCLLSLPSRANVDELLWDAVMGDRRSTLVLSDYEAHAAGFDSLRRSDRWAFHAELSDECPIADLIQFPGTDALLGDPSKSGVRKKLARARRKIESEHVSFVVDRDPQGVRKAMDRVKPLYDRAERSYPRLHLDQAPYDTFLRSSLNALAERGQVAVLTIDINGEPAAFDVYVLVGRVAYAILGRYDPRCADFSPGLLLMDRGVQWAADLGIGRIDWQLGADPYKLRWATSSYDTFNIVAGNPARAKAARPLLTAFDVAYDLKERATSWRT
jgi:CelD/BcsL family acetyltransferase involved in cellulose biosynthesis